MRYGTRLETGLVPMEIGSARDQRYLFLTDKKLDPFFNNQLQISFIKI